MQSRAAAAATAGARLTPCSCLMAEPPAERISVIWMTCAACRTLPQCTTGVYAVLQRARKGLHDADLLSGMLHRLTKAVALQSRVIGGPITSLGMLGVLAAETLAYVGVLCRGTDLGLWRPGQEEECSEEASPGHPGAAPRDALHEQGPMP